MRSMIRKLALLALAAALSATGAHAQAVPQKYDSAATTNATLVRPGNALINLLVVTNSTAALYYLKLYDVAAAPTCNTSTVVFKVAVPFGASSSGGDLVIPLADGMQFFNGIGFCLTGAIGDTDTTNAATGVTINFAIKQ